ncbi:MAG TPA: PAS domain S-box protein [Candidatus Limnocylindrales bacterium]|nr:PAS domain S-box protein [Candidatus Limnocylindrales bacterium]
MTADPTGARAHAIDRSAGVVTPGSLGDEVVRQSLDAIVVSDPAFVIGTWNPAAERMYGIPASEAIGDRFSDIVETFELTGEPLDSAAAVTLLGSTGSWRGRLRHRPRIGPRAGRDVIVDSVVVTLTDAAGAQIGVLGINRDVTASVSLESEIAALAALVVAAGEVRSSTEIAQASLETLCRATGADAGLVTSMDSSYEASARLGLAPATIEVILSFGQLGGPLARALEAPDAYISADVATAPLREDVRAAVLAEGIRHLIVVGLRLPGRLTGILSLGWRREAPLEPSRAIMLQAAALIASSLENARLLAAVEAGLAEERLLTRRMRALVELTRLPDVARADVDTSRVLVGVRQVLDGDAALSARVENGAFVLEGMDDPRLEGARPFIERPIDEFPMTATLQDGAPALLIPVGGPMTTAEGGAAVAAQGFRTIAIFGLHEGEVLIGAVFVGFNRPIEQVEIDERTLEAIGRSVDISFANRRLREVVSASERRYRDLFEHSPEALMVEDRHLRIVDANPAALRLFGEGLIGAEVRDLVEGEPIVVDVDRMAEPLIRDSAVGRRLDGSTFPEEVELRRIEIDGEPHVLAIVHDLTDQVRMQEELVQAQKMEAIGMLVAGVAHELNNPLASIVAFSQLIRTDPALPADLRTQSDLLVQEANRTRVIVQNLLDFARQRPPERARTELRALIESVLGLQSYVFSHNRISVEVAIPDDLPALLVDRGQLQQVLINLTFNSAQAIRDEGRPGRIRIAATRGAAGGGRTVRIAIEDDGPGVSAEVRDRLFVPFVTTKPPGQGTGLGLSVSFGIVAGHGGTLRHEPSPGGGATFVIELPVETETETEAPTSAAEPAVAADAANVPPLTHARLPEDRRVRILVLDDEASLRELLGRVLARSGYEPVLVSTGAAALDVVRSDPPAAILCDHRMAGMSGTEFHTAVGEIDPDLARRFAFMSGDVLNPELREFAQARGVHLLSKPFDIATVAALVATLLDEAPAS